VSRVPPIPSVPPAPRGARERWRRRLVTVPAYVLAFLITVALFPALLLLALAVDVLRRSRTWSTARLTLFLLCFLAVENLGFLLLLRTWLTTRAGSRLRQERAFAVQRLYVGALLACFARLFSLRFQIDGNDRVAPGPLLVFVRHASLIDVLVPGVFIANAHRIELRYVLKKELLIEPCLDIAGHWIPNHFVDRSGQDSEQELDAIRRLKADLGRHEGVILYPEGTRFSHGKRRALIAKLQGEDRADAESLQHLLPVRRGGALALLDAAPACDVLFVGHHGLEGFTRLADIWGGALVGKTVRIRFWREPAASVPATEPERLAWLRERWLRMDAWLKEIE